MRRFLECLLVLLALSAAATSASAQSLPTAAEFQSLLTTCAQGSEVEINADIIGSATTIYEGERTRGAANLKSQTKFLELFPLADRLEALRLYNECIVQLMGQRQGLAAPPPYTPQQPSYAPIIAGFDCAKAMTPTERLICSDAALASTDRYLNSNYGALLDEAKRAGFADHVRAAQRSWIADRDSVCRVNESTLTAEHSRAAAIECLTRETSHRAAILGSGGY